MSYNLNFNLVELCSYSLDPSAIIILTYLHLNYSKKVCKRYSDILSGLNLKKLPELPWDKLLKKRGTVYKSIFKLNKPITTLKYQKILTSKVSVKVKFNYLYYTALLSPYSKTKFIPKEVQLSNVNNLLVHGLAKKTTGGIILIHER